MTGQLLLAASALLLLAACTSGAGMRPGGADGEEKRVALASEARAEARARDDDGRWADDAAIEESRYRRKYPGNCLSDARGLACSDQAPVDIPADAGLEWQGHVAIGFATLADGSRCFGEARNGTPRSENILVVRAYQGVNGVIPRARTLGRIAGTGDPLNFDQVASAGAFLDLCHRMGGAPGATGRAG